MKNDVTLDRLAAAGARGAANEPGAGGARRRWPWMLLLALAAVAVAALFLTRGGARTADTTAPKKVEIMELSPGDTAIIAARALRLTLPVSGSLTALHQATVKSKVAGEVTDTPFAEGMPVRRGQVVVRLDSADLRARMATQQATLDDARARLALARKNQDNNLALLKQKFISQNAVDTAQNNVDVAEASVKSAASQLDIARRAVDDAAVRAPIDGIISKRLVQPGEKAAPDMPLFVVVSLRQLVLEAQVPASEIPKVAPGQQVDFMVEGFAGRQFTGKVVRINPAAEAGSRAMTVYVAVDNADGALKSGMFAKGGITLQTAAPLPLVPMSAIREQNGKPMVLRIDGDRVVAQPVRLGLRNEDEGLVQVADGLSAGARVVIARLDNVKAGSRVRLPAAVPAAGTPVVTAPASKG